jgi:hypothetical protein
VKATTAAVTDAKASLKTKNANPQMTVKRTYTVMMENVKMSSKMMKAVQVTINVKLDLSAVEKNAFKCSV